MIPPWFPPSRNHGGHHLLIHGAAWHWTAGAKSMSCTNCVTNPTAVAKLGFQRASHTATFFALGPFLCSSTALQCLWARPFIMHCPVSDLAHPHCVSSPLPHWLLHTKISWRSLIPRHLLIAAQTPTSKEGTSRLGREPLVPGPTPNPRKDHLAPRWTSSSQDRSRHPGQTASS